MARYGSLGNVGGAIDWMTGGSGAGVGTSMTDTLAYAKTLEEHRRAAAASRKVAIGLGVFFGVAFVAMVVVKTKDDRDYRKGRGIYKR